jgi:hypothetical protein
MAQCSAVQCGAVHHLPVPAPRRASGRRVLRRAALLISAESWMVLWRGERSPEGFGLGGAALEGVMVGQTVLPNAWSGQRKPASQPASQPSLLCHALPWAAPAKVLQ